MTNDVDLAHSTRGRGLFIIVEQVKQSTMSVKYIIHFSNVENKEKWAKH